MDTDEEQKYIDLYCTCKNCGKYELGLQNELCQECLEKFLKEEDIC